VINILILGFDLGAYSWMKQIIDILLVKIELPKIKIQKRIVGKRDLLWLPKNEHFFL